MLDKQIVRISHQKATSLFKKEASGEGSIKDIFGFGEIGVLRTGAKLRRSVDGTYYIFSYAEDGSDLAPYRKFSYPRYAFM